MQTDKSIQSYLSRLSPMYPFSSKTASRTSLNYLFHEHIFLITGLAIFVGAFFYSKKYDVVVPPSIIAYATQVPFVLGLVGISYAIISSSWDEEPGSLLGFKEFGINFQRIKDGLNRTRENAELRDDIQKEKEKLQRK